MMMWTIELTSVGFGFRAAIDNDGDVIEVTSSTAHGALFGLAKMVRQRSADPEDGPVMRGEEPTRQHVTFEHPDDIDRRQHRRG